jgi:hypothetical protein
MSTPAEDVRWIRARAAQIVNEGELDFEDALTQATTERIEWKERAARGRAGKPSKPLRVSLGDLLKAKGNR